MRQDEETERRAEPSETPQEARKPYQKPAVRYEQVFETSALTCGKIHGRTGPCHSNPKNS
jgi:hypothetical protein